MGKYSKQVNKIPTFIKKLRDILEVNRFTKNLGQKFRESY